MSIRLALLTIAVLIFGAPAWAQTGAEGVAANAGAPVDWIIWDDTTYTPVLDEVSQSLAAARKAFEAKDNVAAADALTAAARALEKQAAKVQESDQQEPGNSEQPPRGTRERMEQVVKHLDSLAAQLKAGGPGSPAKLDEVITEAQRADLESRWLVTDVTIWYPVVEEPQRHFLAAAEAYAAKDYKAAADELRKAAGYVRLEAARAAGEGRRALDDSAAALTATAEALEKGTVASAKELEDVFARANHALALAYRDRAAKSWARKAYDEAGNELKAAAHSLEATAAWIGDKAKEAAHGAAADARAVGDRLTSAGEWTRDEVTKGFEALGHALNQLGQDIGVTHKAAKLNPEP